MIIVVATDEEYELARKRFKHKIIIKTGVGGVNVIRKLRKIPKWIKILNFGYVGSNVIPVGTEIEVSQSKLYHPNVEYEETIYHLGGWCKCYTSNDFVLETNLQEPIVFDMELAFICALGFKKIKAIKIVSDNLSLTEYEKSVKN